MTERIECAACSGAGEISHGLGCVSCGGEGFVMREARHYERIEIVEDVPPIPPLPHRSRFSYWLYHDGDGNAHRGFMVRCATHVDEDGILRTFMRDESTNEVTIIEKNSRPRKWRGRLMRTVKNDFDMSDAALLEIEHVFPHTEAFFKSAYEQ